MPPGIALLVYTAGIAGLFAFDRDREARTSRALWLPVLWLFIAGSRSVSSWLDGLGFPGMAVASDSTDQYLDGSPLDRWVLTALLAFGLIVLAGRRRRLGSIFRANIPIIMFFGYCAISFVWSDFPDVALKRWFKALGDLVMVLIVLSDSHPMAAVKKVLARAGFLLVPLSVLLIKYYPDMGRAYDRWTWTPQYTGVTQGKNLLGIICLLFGVASVWRLLQFRRDRKSACRTRGLLAHSTALAMVAWLFWMANSMTSLACFLVACLLLLVANVPWMVRKTWIVHALVLAILIASVSVLSFDVGADLLHTVGRDPTLTGRTDIWKSVLNMTGNPLLGTGFESFWLGPRLESLWKMYWWHPNEAHSGYIEALLNLGWLGLILLVVLMLTGYRNAIRALCRDKQEGMLRLAYVVIALAYNCTESAVRMMHPVWIIFLLGTTEVPGGWDKPTKNETSETVFHPQEEEVTLCLEKAQSWSTHPSEAF
jgi:O-antigen ligase